MYHDIPVDNSLSALIIYSSHIYITSIVQSWLMKTNYIFETCSYTGIFFWHTKIPSTFQSQKNLNPQNLKETDQFRSRILHRRRTSNVAMNWVCLYENTSFHAYCEKKNFKWKKMKFPARKSQRIRRSRKMDSLFAFILMNNKRLHKYS